MVYQKKFLAFLLIVGTFLVACTNNSEQTSVVQTTKATSTDESPSASGIAGFSLPERSAPRQQTSETVPHVQLDVQPDKAVNDELFRRAYLLPEVEDRPTIVSLPGGRGMWLADEVALANPQAIASGREFAHIHTDGSLHAPLPFERALEVAEKGWGERHPWADERDGWEGLVMLYTPLTMEELDITFQLIVESYNYVTGQTISTADY